MTTDLINNTLVGFADGLRSEDAFAALVDNANRANASAIAGTFMRRELGGGISSGTNTVMSYDNQLWSVGRKPPLRKGFPFAPPNQNFSEELQAQTSGLYLAIMTPMVNALTTTQYAESWFRIVDGGALTSLRFGETLLPKALNVGGTDYWRCTIVHPVILKAGQSVHTVYYNSATTTVEYLTDGVFQQFGLIRLANF